MFAVRQIDRALKRLYNIETILCAEEFLIFHFPAVAKKEIASKELQGALYIHQNGNNDVSEDPEVDLGIYLSEGVRSELQTFSEWQSPWTLEQIRAFTIASEEVSHFHYLLFNLQRNRPLSEFELELQGEIDKFLLLYFTDSFSDSSSEIKFDSLFSQLFVNFSLAACLNESQKQRYLDASVYAKKFFQKMRKHFLKTQSISTVLTKTRHFYQMSLADKIAFLG